MRLTRAEVECLSAWAREEWEPDCYQRPAHQYQLTHDVRGWQLALLIKAWTRSEGKRDRDILQAGAHASPPWPWGRNFQARLEEARAYCDVKGPGAAREP